MIEIKVYRHSTEIVTHGTRRTMMRDFTEVCRAFAEYMADNTVTENDRFRTMHDILRAAGTGIKSGFGGVKENDRTES
jgi:hypothetical protein